MNGKRPLQDILPPTPRPRRSFQPSQHLQERAIEQRIPSTSSQPHQPTPPPGRSPRGPRFPRLALWVAGIFALGILSFAFSFLFSGATVTIEPKSQAVQLDATITAKFKPTDDSLPYDVVTTEREISRTIEADGEKEVAERASGRITIYNNYSTASQRLITNTRFETTNGLIYRINKPVVVPGRRTENGQTVPGSLEVEVFADEPGEAYNIGPTDFVIPGFKGSPQYEKIYARSTDAMTGGFVGKRKVVDAERLAAVKAEMERELQSLLVSSAASELPQGYLIFSSGTRFSYTDLPQIDSGASVTVREKGTLTAVILPEAALARILAGLSAAALEELELSIPDRSDLTVTFTNFSSWSEQDKQDLVISLSGRTTLVATVNTASLQAELAGKAKAALDTIIRSGYPGIERATASIRPPWSRHFPDTPEEIAVVEKRTP